MSSLYSVLDEGDFALIHTLQGEDRNAVLDILRDNPDVNVLDAKFCLEKSDHVIIYKDDYERMCGCATFRLWGENKSNADEYIYVIPQMRRTGIGTLLYKALTDISQKNVTAFISSKIETNHLQSLEFFSKSGFVKWYTEFDLYYSGERQPECDLHLVNYSSEYFTQYINAIRDSFYELRKKNDFQPYYCCEPNEERKLSLKAKRTIFIF